MANTDALSNKHSSSRLFHPTVKSHLAFTLLSALALLLMYTLLRAALLVYNRELIGATPAATFAEAFFKALSELTVAVV